MRLCQKYLLLSTCQDECSIKLNVMIKTAKSSCYILTFSLLIFTISLTPSCKLSFYSIQINFKSKIRFKIKYELTIILNKVFVSKKYGLKLIKLETIYYIVSYKTHH